MKSSPYNNWLVVWNIFFCSIQFGMSSSQLTSIFFRGIATTNQNMFINYISYIQNNHQPIHLSTILNVIFHITCIETTNQIYVCSYCKFQNSHHWLVVIQFTIFHHISLYFTINSYIYINHHSSLYFTTFHCMSP